MSKRQRAALILGAVLIVAGVTVWHRWHDRPPFGPAALGARATLRQVDQATADAALAPAQAVVATGASDLILLGQVTWARPPGSHRDVSLRIVLLDKHRHVLPGFIAVTSPDPDRVGVGWDGSLDRAEHRYPWLEGAGTQEADGGFRTTGSVVTVSSVDASPVTFQTVLHTGATAADMLVGLICAGPDGQVYWAERLVN